VLTEAVKMRYRYTITQSIHFTKLLRCQGLFDKMAAILASIGGASSTPTGIVAVNKSTNGSNAVFSDDTLSTTSTSTDAAASSSSSSNSSNTEGNNAFGTVAFFNELSQNLYQVETSLQQSLGEIARLRQIIAQHPPQLLFDRAQIGSNANDGTPATNSDSVKRAHETIIPAKALVEKKRKMTTQQRDNGYSLAAKISPRPTRRQKLG
jgi:hypothetical protein